MNQLTTAQHTAMLHAYYGCKVQEHYDGEIKIHDDLNKIHDLWLLSNPEWFKPELRHIDTLTESEAIEVFNLIRPEQQEPIAYKIYKGKWWVKVDRSSAVTDYLRSICVDVGFLHIPSLINAGLAVDEATI